MASNIHCRQWLDCFGTLLYRSLCCTIRQICSDLHAFGSTVNVPYETHHYRSCYCYALKWRYLQCHAQLDYKDNSRRRCLLLHLGLSSHLRRFCFHGQCVSGSRSCITKQLDTFHHHNHHFDWLLHDLFAGLERVVHIDIVHLYFACSDNGRGDGYEYHYVGKRRKSDIDWQLDQYSWSRRFKSCLLDIQWPLYGFAGCYRLWGTTFTVLDTCAFTDKKSWNSLLKTTLKIWSLVPFQKWWTICLDFCWLWMRPWRC